jgi:hypothetical protein
MLAISSVKSGMVTNTVDSPFSGTMTSTRVMCQYQDMSNEPSNASNIQLPPKQNIP